MKKSILVIFIIICLCAILFGCSKQTTKTECSILAHYNGLNGVSGCSLVQLFFNDDYYNRQLNGNFHVKYVYDNRCECDAELHGTTTQIRANTFYQPNTYIYFEINDIYSIGNTRYQGHNVDVQVMVDDETINIFHLIINESD